MSTRRPRSRAIRPMPEHLETRKLLSTKTIAGQDIDGDRWFLRVEGPGDIRVTKQADAQGNAQSLDSASLIDEITVAGADPLSSRLVGKVQRGANGDGKVFFNSLSELGGSDAQTSGANGIYAIDIPDFWLGQTSADAATAVAPSISIPNGVITLRFGGADTTFTPPGGTALNTNSKADTFSVNLGVPRTQGTSIVIHESITSGQAGATSSTGTPGTPTQDSVVFNVSGRLNVFQADAIQGNTAFPSSGFQGGGGTLVASTPDVTSALTGQIGFVRVGGNATNFGVQAVGTNALVSNFFIGGETNNVQLLAPSGSRTIEFGKGMDTVTILTNFIETLQANRGALNSSVSVDRTIGRVTLGGDVVNTQIISGLQQNLASISQSQQAPTTPPSAQNGGAIKNVLIAGNVQDSIFVASVEPLGGEYGTDQDLKLPHGVITAKVGGTIDNANMTPDAPTTAFFAQTVRKSHGPVIPPSVQELPFAHQGAAPGGKRIVPGLQPVSTTNTSQTAQNAGVSALGARGKTIHTRVATPKGPAKTSPSAKKSSY